MNSDNQKKNLLARYNEPTFHALYAAIPLQVSRKIRTKKAE